MAKKAKMDQENTFFSSQMKADVAVVRFKENPLLRSTDFKLRDVWLEYLDRVERDDKVKVLLIIGYPGKTGRQEYGRFFRRIVKARSDPDNIIRMCNVFNHIILAIMDMSKNVVHADSGRVISLFLNVSLACDWRVVADNTVFEREYLDWGLAPKGGGAYFLTKMLGLARARQIMLADTDLTAYQARKLGIVDEVVSFGDLDDTALKTAQRLAQKPVRSTAAIKRLLNYNVRELREYLEYENQEILRIVARPDFGQGVL